MGKYVSDKYTKKKSSWASRLGKKQSTNQTCNFLLIKGIIHNEGKVVINIFVHQITQQD
jgi:hypothetical protein